MNINEHKTTYRIVDLNKQIIKNKNYHSFGEEQESWDNTTFRFDEEGLNIFLADDVHPHTVKATSIITEIIGILRIDVNAIKIVIHYREAKYGIPRIIFDKHDCIVGLVIAHLDYCLLSEPHVLSKHDVLCTHTFDKSNKPNIVNMFEIPEDMVLYEIPRIVQTVNYEEYLFNSNLCFTIYLELKRIEIFPINGAEKNSKECLLALYELLNYIKGEYDNYKLYIYYIHDSICAIEDIKYDENGIVSTFSLIKQDR